MKKFIVVCLLLLGCESTKASNTNVENVTYEIICKHPFGHIERFKVDQENFDMPMNFRGGLWDFVTIEGTKIKSSNCHSTSKSQEKTKQDVN